MRQVGYESLEGRRMLSVALLNGVLTVKGSASSDNYIIETIVVTRNGASVAQAQVTENGLVKIKSLSSVSSVVVTSGSGDDNLLVRENGAAWLVPFTIQAGDGNDQVEVQANTICAIYGDAGNDTLSGGQAA